MNKKIGRNDPCPCGSGKKFKKCCESKMIGKKYLAHKVESVDQTSTKISSLSSVIPSSISDPIERFAEKQKKLDLEKKEITIEKGNEDSDKTEKTPKKATTTPKKRATKKTKTENS